MYSEKFKRIYEYHEKYKAWVIHKYTGSVNLIGGSWFETEHFENEQELLDYLEEKYQNKFDL